MYFNIPTELPMPCSEVLDMSNVPSVFQSTDTSYIQFPLSSLTPYFLSNLNHFEISFYFIFAICIR